MGDYGIPISEMKDFATDLGSDMHLSSDIGNVISLGGDGDDLGMSLLANSKYTGGGSGTPPRQAATPVQSFNIGGGGGGGSGGGGGYERSSGQVQFGGIDIQPLPTIESINLDVPLSDLGAMPEVTVSKMESSGSAWGQSYDMGAGASTGAGSGGIQLRDPEAERKEKTDLITKLSRLEAKGYPVARRFTMDNTLEEVKAEYNRLVDAKQLEGSIKFQRQMMMTLTTGMEMMNEKFNPFDWQLKGWSESVHESIEDFDEVFEELYDKYKERGKMPPEARLLFMMVGSGFMFHMSNSFFRNKMPSAEDILKNNPALAKQFAAAAAREAGPGYGNFMGMAMGGQGQAPPQMGQAQPMPMPAQVQMPQQYAAAPAPAPRAPRKEMSGPSGVDDILKAFQEVRESELQFGTMPVMPQPIPASAGQQSMIFSQPAIVAAAEIQSIHTDDMMSQAESTRTGGTRGGGQRRRKTAAPIGNSITLDV
jgi:hypothetical protein